MIDLEAQLAARLQRRGRTPGRTSRSTRRRRPRASRSRRSRRTCPRCRGSRAAGRRRGRSRPAARTRSRARSCCSFEIVIDVTRQPSSPAAYSANPPQPVPISRTCMPCLQASALGRSAGTCSAAHPRATGSGDVEHRARVRHRLVQEEPVEVVAEVVMGGDVPAGLGVRVAARPMGEPPWDLEGDPPPALGQRERRAVERRQLDERRQVGLTTTGRPCTPHRHRSRRAGADGRRPPRRGCGSRRGDRESGSPKTRRRPSGRTTVSRPTLMRDAAAKPTRSATDMIGRSGKRGQRSDRHADVHRAAWPGRGATPPAALPSAPPAASP